MYFVIEHFETEVSRWTLCEYTHMLLILSNLYADPKVKGPQPTRLILTNFKFADLYSSGKLEEDEFSTKKHVEQFLKINKSLGGKALVSKYDLKTLTT